MPNTVYIGHQDTKMNETVSIRVWQDWKLIKDKSQLLVLFTSPKVPTAMSNSGQSLNKYRLNKQVYFNVSQQIFTKHLLWANIVLGSIEAKIRKIEAIPSNCTWSGGGKTDVSTVIQLIWIWASRNPRARRERGKSRKTINQTKNIQYFPNFPSDFQSRDFIKYHLSQFFNSKHNYSMETRQRFSARFYEQKQWSKLHLSVFFR